MDATKVLLTALHINVIFFIFFFHASLLVARVKVRSIAEGGHGDDRTISRSLPRGSVG